LFEEQQRAVNFYVWDSKEAAEGFFTDELRERTTGLYGVAPVIDFVEIAEIVDNSIPQWQAPDDSVAAGQPTPAARISTGHHDLDIAVRQRWAR
jgi:hypothetical protein